jgi:hypothetical protein
MALSYTLAYTHPPSARLPPLHPFAHTLRAHPPLPIPRTTCTSCGRCSTSFSPTSSRLRSSLTSGSTLT